MSTKSAQIASNNAKRRTQTAVGIVKRKRYSILGALGSFFEGTFAGTICFVPRRLIRNGALDDAQYVVEGWASLNIKAQTPRNGIGSHLFPNLDKPCTDVVRCERLKARIEQLRPESRSRLAGIQADIAADRRAQIEARKLGKPYKGVCLAKLVDPELLKRPLDLSQAVVPEEREDLEEPGGTGDQ